MKRYGLDPLNERTCKWCNHIVYDVDKGFECRLHPNTDMSGTLVNEVTDCEDWKSPYIISAGTTPTYDRRIKKNLKKGGRT